MEIELVLQKVRGQYMIAINKLFFIKTAIFSESKTFHKSLFHMFPEEV